MSEALPHGKICYIEIPTDDVATPAAFYNKAFGWKIRIRGNGATAFDDATGYVSGAWVLNRSKSPTPGLPLYIAVNSVAATCELIPTLGGSHSPNHGS